MYVKPAGRWVHKCESLVILAAMTMKHAVKKAVTDHYSKYLLVRWVNFCSPYSHSYSVPLESPKLGQIDFKSLQMHENEKYRT